MLILALNKSFEYLNTAYIGTTRDGFWYVSEIGNPRNNPLFTSKRKAKNYVRVNILRLTPLR